MKIKGKEYELEMPWAVYRKIAKRVSSPMITEDITTLEPEEREKKVDEQAESLIDNLWDCLKPNWLGFKPYLTKKRLLKNITAKELISSDRIIGELMAPEDRDEGNSAT